MPDTELLRVLGNCLKGSRAKVYENEMKVAHRDESHLKSPRKVYDATKKKMMRFRETNAKKQVRIMPEFSELRKGGSTADQFEAAWVNAVTELESVGLGMGDQALFLAYLQRLDPNMRFEIQKDRRTYTGEDGR